MYPIFGPALFLFRFSANHTAITRRLSTINPTTAPIATAPPVPKTFLPEDVAFADALLPLVDSAVGFSVGIEGKGDNELGLPVVDGVLGVAGGEIVGGEEVEGTEGGGDANLGVEGEVVEGGGADLDLDGGGVSVGGEEELSGGGVARGEGGDFEEGGVATLAGGGAECELT